MKNLLLFAAVSVFAIGIGKAQSIHVGANLGLPLSAAGNVSSFNVGVDGAYLVEVIDNLEVGGLIGYTHYFGDGSYSYRTTNNGNLIVAKYDDTSFVPIAASGRYSFADKKFFGGLDLGYAINVSGDADGGLYYRPKFGYNLGVVSLLAMYQGISGGVNYGNYNYGSIASVSGFNSFSVGVEMSF